MGFLDGFNPDDFNFGNFGNDNPFDTDPFPMEDFRAAQIPQMLNPPQQQNTISGVMNEIGSGVQQNPTLSRYFDLAAQGPPKREDYEPSTGRKILAAVGGLGYLFSDPRNAVKNTEAILDHPYDEAAGQYKNDLATASDAAKQEASLMNTGTNIFGHISQEENYRNMAGNRQGTLDYKYAGLDSRERLANAKLAIADRQQKATEDYNNHKISLGEYNAQTARNNSDRQQAESASLIAGRESNMQVDRARIDALNRGPISGNRSTGPNAALMNRQLESAIKSDPILTDPSKRFFLPDGTVNIPRILADPEASIAYQRLQRRYGMVQQPPAFDMNDLFNTPTGYNDSGEP